MYSDGYALDPRCVILQPEATAHGMQTLQVRDRNYELQERLDITTAGIAAFVRTAPGVYTLTLQNTEQNLVSVAELQGYPMVEKISGVSVKSATGTELSIQVDDARITMPEPVAVIGNTITVTLGTGAKFPSCYEYEVNNDNAGS